MDTLMLFLALIFGYLALTRTRSLVARLVTLGAIAVVFLWPRLGEASVKISLELGPF